MDRETVIALAREAGLFVPQAGIPKNGALMRFAALVEAYARADERELFAYAWRNRTPGKSIAPELFNAIQ